MRPTCNGPGALAGADGAGNRFAERQAAPDTTLPCIPPELARFRRRRAVRRLYRLGARPVFELLDEIARHHPAIAADLDRRLDTYARLSPELLRAVGGDRFPPAPIRLIRPGPLDGGGS